MVNADQADCFLEIASKPTSSTSFPPMMIALDFSFAPFCMLWEPYFSLRALKSVWDLSIRFESGRMNEAAVGSLLQPGDNAIRTL